MADRLARRFRVITVDNRGVGASDTPPGHSTTRSMAQDVLAVLDHAGIQPASVLGTSLGGMVAQELALTHPERVDQLVLVATIPGGPRSYAMIPHAGLSRRPGRVLAQCRNKAVPTGERGRRWTSSV